MSKKLYAERDIEGLDEDGNFYFKHVMAMTSEGLHGKSAIAAELGYRDSKIVELQARLEAAMTERDNALTQNLKLLECLHSIQSQCIGEIAMNYRLDAQNIGQEIYQATGLTEPELREKLQ